MSRESAPTVSVNFSDLEALHDVLEAARCYWHQRQPSARAAETLRVANRLFWTIGEYLPKTGVPSDRFQAVHWSSDDGVVGQLLNFVESLQREYTKKHDPWWADTIVASNDFATKLSPEEWRTFVSSLKRLGLTLEIDSELPPNHMVAERRDLGPWPEENLRTR